MRPRIQRWVDGKITLEKLLSKTGYSLLENPSKIGNMPFEQQKFLQLLDKDPQEAGLWMAKWNADNSQWMYKPSERGLAEISSEDRWMFNLYVWFEVMLIASFVLMSLGNRKAQLDGTMKYVAMNLIATILILTAIAMLYGMTGTLKITEL